MAPALFAGSLGRPGPLPLASIAEVRREILGTRLLCACAALCKVVLSSKTYCIDPMHKWLPIKNSFGSIKISPTNLV